MKQTVISITGSEPFGYTYLETIPNRVLARQQCSPLREARSAVNTRLGMVSRINRYTTTSRPTP